MTEQVHDPSLQNDADANDNVTITTKPFEFTPQAYLKTMLRITLGKHWWFFPFAATVFLILESVRYLFSGYFGHEPHSELAVFVLLVEIGLLVYILAYYFCIYWQLRAAAYHQSNKVVMRPRVVTLSRKKIIVNADNDDEEDSVWVYKNEDIFQTMALKRYYLFFLTPLLFVFVLKDAFQSDADRELFEKTILPAYPRQKSELKRGILFYFVILAVTIAAGIAAALISGFIFS